MYMIFDIYCIDRLYGRENNHRAPMSASKGLQKASTGRRMIDNRARRLAIFKWDLVMQAS